MWRYFGIFSLAVSASHVISLLASLGATSFGCLSTRTSNSGGIELE